MPSFTVTKLSWRLCRAHSNTYQSEGDPDDRPGELDSAEQQSAAGCTCWPCTPLRQGLVEGLALQAALTAAAVAVAAGCYKEQQTQANMHTI